MKIGLHISAAGGTENAPERAKDLGAECFQFFSRSPRGGAAPKISDEQVKLFRERSEAYGMESYIHTPYYINFASKKRSLAAAAPRIIREELERASWLGVQYVVTHLGSAFEWGEDLPPLSLPLRKGEKTTTVPPLYKGKLGGVSAAVQQVIKGLKKIYEGKTNFSAQLLLEVSAGSGAVIGDNFEELGNILEQLGRKDVHICLDTCHMFASGHDLRTPEAVAETMNQFNGAIGRERLKLVHANDSKTSLGSHKDRHEHIGKGEIGAAGFKAVMAHPDFQQVNFVAETPHDKFIGEDLRVLKSYRAV